MTAIWVFPCWGYSTDDMDCFSQNEVTYSICPMSFVCLFYFWSKNGNKEALAIVDCYVDSKTYRRSHIISR